MSYESSDHFSDTVPDIRLICITELGRWMEIHPEHYIDDSYLKYIGWNLHDKVWRNVFFSKQFRNDISK